MHTFRNYHAKYAKVREYREKYPAGTRIRVTRFDDKEVADEFPLATVSFVDGLCTLHVTFDNGAKCSVIPGIDSFRFLTDAEVRADLERGA